VLPLSGWTDTPSSVQSSGWADSAPAAQSSIVATHGRIRGRLPSGRIRRGALHGRIRGGAPRGRGQGDGRIAGCSHGPMPAAQAHSPFRSTPFDGGG
jgi:hypothetical protein